MQTPQKSNKSSHNSNDSLINQKPQLYSSNSSLQTGANSNKNSNKKPSETKVLTQLIQTSQSKGMLKPQNELTMVNSKTKIPMQSLQQKYNANKPKPVKATVNYDIKLNGFEVRSRQTVSNQLNQSLSENKAYDSNVQLMEDQMMKEAPYTVRGESNNEYYDQPTNLITHNHHYSKHSPTYSLQIVNNYPPVDYIDPDQLNLNLNEQNAKSGTTHTTLLRRFSNSTEKLVSNALSLSKANPHNSSQGSIGLGKQRRSRTQRRIQRERSNDETTKKSADGTKRELRFTNEDEYDEDERQMNEEEQKNLQNPGVYIISNECDLLAQIQINENELKLENIINQNEEHLETTSLYEQVKQEMKEECERQMNHSMFNATFNINSINTVDEFAKSLLNNSYVKTPNSKRSSVEHCETTSKSYINKILDIYYPKTGNSESKPTLETEPKFINTQSEPISNMMNMPSSPPSNETQNTHNKMAQIYSTDESVEHLNITHKELLPNDEDDLKNQSLNLQQQQSQQQNQQQPSNNLNEDINMQLYGQISMFDQLTDYIENENDDEQQFSPSARKEQMGRGEDEDSCYGEGDDSKDLHEYRQRINVMNEDIQSFIMDAGEDGDGNQDGEGNSNPLHNLHFNTSANQIFDEPIQNIENQYESNNITEQDQNNNNNNNVQQITMPSIEECAVQDDKDCIINKLNEKIASLLYQVSDLEEQVSAQNEEIGMQSNQILQLNKEKMILQDLLENKKENEIILNDQLSHYESLTREHENLIQSFKIKDQETNEKMEMLTKENQVLRSKLAQFFSVQQTQKATVSLEDKTNKNYSSPQSQNIVFRKYTKQSNGGSNKCSPKGQISYTNNTYQQQDTSDTQSLQSTGTVPKHSYVNKSIEQSSASGKSLLDKILQNKGNEKTVLNKHQQQPNMNEKRQSLTNLNKHLMVTPQKGKTTQKLQSMMGQTSNSNKSGHLFGSGQKNGSSKALNKESTISNNMTSPKQGNSRKSENIPKSYYQ